MLRPPYLFIRGGTIGRICVAKIFFCFLLQLFLLISEDKGQNAQAQSAKFIKSKQTHIGFLHFA